jgi:hypothetical protein
MDAATGDLVSKTETLPDNPAVINSLGASFSSDGAQIAATFTIKPSNGAQQVMLASFDVKTGKSSGALPIGNLRIGDASNPMYWGTRHFFVAGKNARIGGYVLEWPSGKGVRHLEVGNKNFVGYIARTDLGNRLWYAAAQSDFQTAYLVAVDLPQEELRADQGMPDPSLRLAAEGIIKRQ